MLERKGLEELKKMEAIANDQLEDTLREKAIKEKRNSYFNVGKVETLTKNSFLPSI